MNWNQVEGRWHQLSGQLESEKELSQHRAQAIRDYLVSRGIASDRITGQGFGSTRSVADDVRTAGHAVSTPAVGRA
jgi:outer membrane protein OmpA-like peptidoglycan-associated protein